MSKLIALLTDFGASSPYLGIMKGVISSLAPKSKIIDITHRIRQSDIFAAAFLLKCSYRYFPKGAIFTVVVDPEVGSKRKALLIKTRNYYFVGPDNGVLTLAAKSDGIESVIHLVNKKYFLLPLSSTFWGRDVFAPVAAHIYRNKNVPKDMGKEIPFDKIKYCNFPAAQEKGRKITATVVYIDPFGNIVLNLTRNKLFPEERPFSAHYRKKTITKFYDFYDQAEEGELFFIEGSFGFVELSLKNSSAAEKLKAKIGDKIIILKGNEKNKK